LLVKLTQTLRFCQFCPSNHLPRSMYSIVTPSTRKRIFYLMFIAINTCPKILFSTSRLLILTQPFTDLNGLFALIQLLYLREQWKLSIPEATQYLLINGSQRFWVHGTPKDQNTNVRHPNLPLNYYLRKLNLYNIKKDLWRN